MKTPHVFSASAAAVLAMAMAAFAEAPQAPAQPSQAPRPSTQAPAGRQAETQVTLVGCIQREAEYRKANDSGKGGPVGTGVGLGNEYVLVNASTTASGAAASSAAGDCGSAAQGEAYELTGSRERELDKFVGRRVEITGMLKEAKTTTGPDGAAKPTGGFDPLKQDLKLFELEVRSFREPSAGQSAQAAPPVAAAAPSPAPAQAAPVQPAPAQPAPQPSPSTEPRQQLPRTASPVPLVGLFGALSLALGVGLRVVRKHTHP